MKRLYFFLFILVSSVFGMLKVYAFSPLLPPADDTVNSQLYLASAAPEFGATVDELSVITMTWNFNDTAWRALIGPDYAQDIYNPEVPYFKLKVTCCGKPVTSITPQISNIAYTSPRSATLTLTLDKAITAKGVYTIEIPEGFVMDSGSPEPQKNGKTTLKYRIGDAEEWDEPLPEEPITGVFHLDSTSPDVNFEMDSFSFISAQWLDSNDNPCIYDGPSELDLFTIIDREQVKAGKLKVSSGNGKIFFQLNHIADAIGKYFFTVPAGSVKSADGSETNAADEIITATILYRHGKRPSDYFPYPGKTLDFDLGSSLSTFAIIYSDDVTVNSYLPPYLIDENGNVIPSSSWIRPSESTNQGTASFSNAASLPSGRYVFYMPRNAIAGADGIAYFVDYRAPEKPVDIEVPDGTVVTIEKCSIDSYNLMDPDNGLAWLNDGANITIATNIDYACDAVWYKILDITDCQSEKDYLKAPTVYSNSITGKGLFSGIIHSAGSRARRLSNDRLYCIEAIVYQNYNNASYRKQWGPCYSPAFRGGAEPYQYADIKVLNVSPVPGGELTSGTPVIMTFESPVNYLYDLSGIPLGKQGSLKINGTSNADGTVWSFSIPDTAFESSSFEAHLAFDDPATGLKVRPSDLNAPESDNTLKIKNYGTEDATCIWVTYGNYSGGIDFNIEPAPGTIDSLYDFRFSYNNEEFSPSWISEKATLKDAAGNIAATLICDRLAEDGGNVRLEYMGEGSSDSYSIAVNLKLDNVVANPGTYTLEFPYAYFTSGREKESFYSKPATFEYTVTGNSTSVGCIYSPTALFTVYNMQGIKILTDADSESLKSLRPGLYIVNGEKTLLK